MNRRSSRTLRVENFIYEYNKKTNKWLPKNKILSEDLFKTGVFYTCKKIGQKVNPVGFRLKTNNFWNSSWVVSKNNYTKYLHQDLNIKYHRILLEQTSSFVF